MVDQVLADKGIVTESMKGGITELPQAKGRQIPELIRIATK